MKKILIFLSFLILILLALPIIGNKYIEDALNSKIQELKANGVGVSSEIVDSSYLETSRHYEFYIQNPDKFISYLNSYPDEQLSAYVELFLEGALVGSDLKYSNLPFMKALMIEIYPLSLSSKMKEELEIKDLAFSKEIDSFLKDKGVLYHLDYDILTQSFDGYIKDIDEEYTLQDSSKLVLKLQNALYSGEGELIAPKILKTKIETISLKLSKQSELIDFQLHNFINSSKFESINTYTTTMSVQNIDINISAMSDEDILLSAKDFATDIRANAEGKNARVSMKSSLKDLHINSKDVDFQSSSFKYGIALREMDKDSLSELRVVLSKLKYHSPTVLEDELNNALILLLSRGMKIDVDELSLNDIVLDNTQNLESISLQSTLNINEDKNLALKVNYAPLLLLSTVDTNIKLKLSKKIFALISASFPMLQVTRAYAKEDAANLIYELTFQNGKLKINGKALYN